jgi:hypothetical protein
MSPPFDFAPVTEADFEALLTLRVATRTASTSATVSSR